MYLQVVLVLFLMVLTSASGPAEQGMAIDPATCLGCHSDRFSIKDHLPRRSTARMPAPAATRTLPICVRHMKSEIKVQKVQCERCHKRVNAEHYASVHIATRREVRRLSHGHPHPCLLEE